MLPKFSVEKRYTVFVAVILVLILGAVSFINLQTDLLPKIDLPYLLVMTSYPGASPEEVEMVVTRPIEQVVATTNNIKNISSVSRENSSIVILEFNNDVNLDSATIEINGNLDLIKAAWSDSVGSSMIMRLNPEMLPIMVAAVDIEGKDTAEVSQIVRGEILPELESVNGVASVSGVGLLEEKIEVVISSEKITELNQKILANVDAELAQAERQLLAARKKIQSGKAQLAAENEKQSAKITAGAQAIAVALKQIEQAEVQMIAGEPQLEQTKKALQSVLDVINYSEEQLIAQKEALLKQEELTEAEQTQLEFIAQSLTAVAAKKAETNNDLAVITAQTASLQEQKTLLTEQKQSLAEQEKQLQSGRQLLAAEMEKAKTELLSGEITLNQKITEFERAKEEAFKNASLEGALTPKMIAGVLAAQNFAMPAGYLTESGTDYLVKVGDKLSEVDELTKLVLFDTGISGIEKIRLDDVAEIAVKDNADDTYAKVNGNNAVILTFQKQSNFSTAAVSDSIEKKFAELLESNEKLNLTALMDQGVYIGIVIDSVLDNLIYGGLLAVLILWLFLRDLKPTLIIALSIPISVVFAIAMMYFSGLTMNIISLAGLALGIGMLVDNSIVVIENIYRLRNEGVPVIQAAIEGAKEVMGAIAASTFTTACVFLPIVFTQGITRQIFADMGLTIAYSLFASLIVAITLVPTLASIMLNQTQEKEHHFFDGLLKVYERTLRWSLQHKAIVLVFVVALLGLSGFLALSMGTSFIPEMEAPQMSVAVTMPPEASFAEALAMSETVIERIDELAEIETIGAFQNSMMGGMGGLGSGGSGNSVSLYLVLKEDKARSNTEIAAEIRSLTADLECSITVTSSNMDISALGGAGLEVIIKGRELDTLREIAAEITQIMQATAGTVEVSDGMEQKSTELRIAVNKEKAAEKGLTVAQVFASVNSLLADKNATTLSVANQDYPVIIIDGKSQTLTRDNVADLVVAGSQNGESTEVKLADIAAINEAEGLSSITRDAQERYISVTASIDADHNIGLVSRELEEKLQDYQLPSGYRVELAGETELINNSFVDLIYMLLLAIVFIYLIMVAQFQSLLSPFIVMFTIPLAFTGGLLALAITGYELSLIAMLGFLVLSGVVVNNGIVFVDYTNQIKGKGLSVKEALITAGKTRLRPILMTALTTILGLSTLSLGVGMGAETLQPLAITAIGGLAYATVLTLLVVPVMYALFNKDQQDHQS
ncbi:MAG TPA: efflux RND transporter permease subunit [Oscillospiraceae bacterium]|nr:efflux RND transporter permease subunit [Oscillospiraceae bacterium]